MVGGYGNSATTADWDLVCNFPKLNGSDADNYSELAGPKGGHVNVVIVGAADGAMAMATIHDGHDVMAMVVHVEHHRSEPADCGRVDDGQMNSVSFETIG
jgi:hypothetical protein